MSTSDNTLYIKIALIAIITLALIIPLAFTTAIIEDREATRQHAIAEVTDTWSTAQLLAGPFLTIPYHTASLEPGNGIPPQSASENSSASTLTRQYLHIMPSELHVEADIRPETRHRGIFEVVVYVATVQLSGYFTLPEVAVAGIDPGQLLRDQAEFVVGLTDLRGISHDTRLRWNEVDLTFEPGVSSADVVQTGIHAEIPLHATDHIYRFTVEVTLRGSERFHVAPVGQQTSLNLRAPWPDPSFNGAFLPDEYTTTDDRFEASWQVGHLNRNFPHIWSGDRHNITDAGFGVDLLLPVDHYQKSYRAITYAILVIGLTFVAFFFADVRLRVRVHPMHYLLVGAALTLFFLLLVAISEHIPFNVAYLIAGSSTITLIGLFVHSALKSAVLTPIICGMLVLLYGFIFVVIQLQDFALLVGSIGLFIVLATVMYISRHINWHKTALEESTNSNIL